MILAIVGSRSLKGHPEVIRVIRTILDNCEPTLVISGGADGPDTHGIDEARERGIRTKVYYPETRDWEHGYKPRNILIVDRCDLLVAFIDPTSKTYGAGWTLNYYTKTKTIQPIVYRIVL